MEALGPAVANGASIITWFLVFDLITNAQQKSDIFGKLGTVAKTIGQVSDVLDRSFGVSLFGLRSFFVSCIVSILSVASLTLVWFATNTSDFYIFFKLVLVDKIIAIPGILILITWNLLPDFISIVKSRYLLRKLRHTDNLTLTLAVTIFDILLTILFFFSVWLFTSSLWQRYFLRSAQSTLFMYLHLSN